MAPHGHAATEHGPASPIKAILKVRLEEGRRQLATADNTLEAIAAACGMQSTPYFCRLFKHVMHTTPSQYRRKARTKQR